MKLTFGSKRAARPIAGSRRWLSLTLVLTTWVYAFAVLATLALIRFIGEHWWPVSLLLFCPRPVYLAPAVPLALVSGLTRRYRLLTTQAAIALAAAGPLMDFRADAAWNNLSPAQGGRVRVLTLNQHNHQTRVRDLIALIRREQVDVVCLQETVFDPSLEEFLSRGWYRDPGRCIASRFPIVHHYPPLVASYDDPLLDMVRLRTAVGLEFVVASVHRPTMRPGLEAILKGDVMGLRRTIDERRAAMVELVSRLDQIGNFPVLLAGDFNTPADSSLLDPLRDRFHVGFEHAGWGYGYTWPARCPGLRIDHVLSNRLGTFTFCEVGPDVGSDHLPVIAEVWLSPPEVTTERSPGFR